MEKTCKNVPISSTPHPQRIVHQSNGLFGNDTIPLSPITQPVQPIETKHHTRFISRKSSRHHLGAVDSVIPKKKPSLRAEKGTAASNAVLEELNVNKEMLGQNALSHSRNMYNMFPEPILLDSDEEDELLSLRFSKVAPTKKVMQTSKLTTAETSKSNKDVGRRKIHQLDKMKCKVKYVNSSSSSTKPNTLKNLGATEKKLPLENVANILSPKMYDENNKKKNAKKASSFRALSPSIVVLDEKESIFSLVPDNLSDVGDSDIEYIATNSHKLKRNPNAVVDTNNHCVDKNAVDIGLGFKKACNSNLKFPTIESVNDLEIAQSESQNEVGRNPCKTSDQMGVKKQIEKAAFSDHLKNKRMNRESKKITFSEECKSHFDRVVFRRNNHFGATVAKCLDTGSNDFGYLEIGTNHAFTGTRPNTTFVVLEGQVQACQAGAKETFCQGDILHISTDAEYQFKNRNATNARLLYIRDKRPIHVHENS